MPEVKVQRDTKVVLALSEEEAQVLATILWKCVDHDRAPPVVSLLASALEDQEITETAYCEQYDKSTDMFAIERSP